MPIQCAIREVEEETGFNATRHIRKSRDFEHRREGYSTRLFIAADVPMDFKFEPQVDQEIG